MRLNALQYMTILYRLVSFWFVFNAKLANSITLLRQLYITCAALASFAILQLFPFIRSSAETASPYLKDLVI